jgi:methylmalonyl-CoA/ethylmalonyl-CoA epimerase
MFLRLDHIGIVAPDINEALKVLVDQLGLEFDEDRAPLPDGSYFAPEATNNYFVQVGDGQTQIEILIPQNTTSGVARYMAKNGSGLHHIAYQCTNIGDEADRLSGNGLTMIDLGPEDPDRMRAAFFHPKSVMGILTELVPDRETAMCR